jgi:hypothetical protein
MIPDSAVKVRMKSGLGVSPEQRRHRSEYFQALAWCLPRCRALSLEIALCTEAKWLLRGKGLLASLCRAYAERSTLFPTAQSGLTEPTPVATVDPFQPTGRLRGGV